MDLDRELNQLLGAALDEWEARDGAFTPDELADAAAILGRPSGRQTEPTRR